MTKEDDNFEGKFSRYIRHLPKSKPKDTNASTKGNPIKYFEYLFDRGGLTKLFKEFIPTSEECEYRDLIYDSKTETITEYYQDQETGKMEEGSKKEFKKIYEHLLYEQSKISSGLLDDRISELPDNHSRTQFITLTLSKLKYLLKAIAHNSIASKYDFSSKPILEIIQYLKEKYADYIKGDFISSEKGTQTEPEANIINQETDNLGPQKGIKTFKWKTSQHEHLSQLLFKKLKAAKFIDESTEFVTFNKAFNGSYQENPLKITWIAIGKNRQVNKHLLIDLFNKLGTAQLIGENMDNPTFLKTINFIFCDSKGNSLQYLKNSYSSAGKKVKEKKQITPQEVSISRIIEELKGQSVTK